MAMHDTRERAFIQRIDCSFPYHQPQRWQRTLAQVRSLSVNAVFVVAYELRYPPRTKQTSAAVRWSIWQLLRQRAPHPLMHVLAGVIRACIHGRDIPAGQARRAMRPIRAYPQLYSALALCTQCCDDRSGKIAALHDAIMASWRDKPQRHR